ncbi:MAG TPA: DUF3422 family protein [Rhizomicrobium sp.]
MSAFEGLAARLRFLTKLISARDDLADSLVPPAQLTPQEAKAWRRAEERKLVEARNDKLKDYRRDSQSLRFDREYPEPRAGEYTTRVFTYLHGEFGFNAPRPIGRTTRATHLVFAPLFVEKIAEEKPVPAGSFARFTARLTGRWRPPAGLPPISETDPAKIIGCVTSETLQWLWNEAIHEPDNTESFRGGRDPYFHYVKELFDFSEPFITPKRSIVFRKEALMRRADDAKPAPNSFSGSVKNQAQKETAELEARIRDGGPSNRLTNNVEYFWKVFREKAPVGGGQPADKEEIAHFRWTRHARPHQTFTFTHELPGYRGMSFDNTGGDPFETTALHAFPTDFFADGETLQDGVKRRFPGILGRFVQGANWIIVPAEAFFEQSTGPNGGKFLDNLALAAGENPRLSELLGTLRNRRGDDGALNVTHREVREIFDHANLSKTLAYEIDRLVEFAVRDFLGRAFRDDPDNLKNEIVGFKCMNGRGYIFANIRHDSGQASEPAKDLFTRSVIIDCGMHKFQRGRLLQNMAEFATERAMALRWIARFRLIHSALSVIESKLNLAVSNYHNRKEQFSSDPNDKTSGRPAINSVVPYAYWHELHPDVPFDPDGKSLTPHSASKERKLIIALEFISSCLTLMNDIVEGGMMDRAGGTVGSVESLRGKLRSVREAPIIGYQTLTDFIERRFIPATRVIGRAGERYHRLRERVSAVAELINANLSATEWHENHKHVRRQTTLLTAAEVVGAFAFGYYGSNLAVDFIKSYCRTGTAHWWPSWFPAACEAGNPALMDHGLLLLIYGSFSFVVALLLCFTFGRTLLEKLRD